MVVTVTILSNSSIIKEFTQTINSTSLITRETIQSNACIVSPNFEGRIDPTWKANKYIAPVVGGKRFEIF